MENPERIHYRINDWDEKFETAKSRTIDHKSWGAYPLKHGSGYCRLMSKKGGASVYGSFIAMCSIVHQKPKETRQGYLTDTGGIPGYSYDEIDISAMTRITLSVIRNAIKELIIIRWLTPCDSTGKNIEGYHEDTARIPREPYTERTDRTEGTEDFDAFWKQVPNKLSKGKARDAYKSALKKPGVTHDIIMAGLPGYTRYENGRKKLDDYRPLHPATWLNGERWADEIPGAPKKKTGFSITVRFTDDRPPKQINIKDDAQLAEIIEEMKLTPFSNVEREYLQDVEEFEKRRNDAI